MSKYLDTRDLDERKTELESLRDAVTEAQEAVDTLAKDVGVDSETLAALESAKEAFGDDEKAELAELESIESEMDSRQFRDGETLIPEDSFTDYIMETLEDCGTLPKDLPWYVAIDRDQTAENCKADYSEVNYQGETYLVRSC